MNRWKNLRYYQKGGIVGAAAYMILLILSVIDCILNGCEITGLYVWLTLLGLPTSVAVDFLPFNFNARLIALFMVSLLNFVLIGILFGFLVNKVVRK